MYGQLPSQRLGMTNDWAAYQLDNAVTFLGITIENALQERVEVGDGKSKEYRDKYALWQLLDDEFRLPRPQRRQPYDPMAGFVDALKAQAHNPRSGVRMWEYVGPEKGENGNQ